MIKLQNIICNKGKFKVDIPNIEIAKTNNINIIGPSGSGKSTLLKLIAGIEPLDSGTISIRDILISSNNRNAYPVGISYLSQDYGLWPNLTSAQHLALVRTRGSSKKPNNLDDEMLDKVGLTAERDKKPFQLSEGQQQRLALARALSSNAKILLLDEPFSNSDIVTISQLNKVIKDFCSESIIRIQIIHDLKMLTPNDTVISMNDGKVIEFGIWEEILNAMKKKDINTWLKKAIELL